MTIQDSKLLFSFETGNSSDEVLEPDEKPTEAIKAAKPLDIESEPATHTTDLSPTQSEPEAQANVGAGTSFEDLENTDLFLMNVPQPEEETSEEEESSENEGSEVVEQFVDAELNSLSDDSTPETLTDEELWFLQEGLKANALADKEGLTELEFADRELRAPIEAATTDAALSGSSSDPATQQEATQAKVDRGPLALSQLRLLVEALLFTTPEPLSSKMIMQQLNDDRVKPEDLAEAVGQLYVKYGGEKSGIHLVEVADGWQFRTNPALGHNIRQLKKIKKQRMSQPTLETLAIIAYRQPFTRAEIDNIRGADSSHNLRTLLEKRLIKMIGRSDLPGKPVVYGTSKEFLEFFQLKDLNSLPNLADFAEIDAYMGEKPKQTGFDAIERAVDFAVESQNAHGTFSAEEEYQQLDGALKNNVEVLKQFKLQQAASAAAAAQGPDGEPATAN